MKSWGSARPRTWLACAALLAMLAFVYRPVLHGHLLAGRDVFRIFFPDSAFLLESLHAGEVPLWNPYLRLGQPFAATLYSQVFYPPRWVAILLAGPIVSMTVMQLAHAALAAVGVFLFARKLRASWPAALVASATFGLSPMMTDLGLQQNVMDAAAWSGLILLATHELTRRPGPTALVRLASLGALSLFAGSPETTLWQGLVAMVYAGLASSRGTIPAQAVPAPIAEAPALSRQGPDLVPRHQTSSPGPGSGPLSQSSIHAGTSTPRAGALLAAQPPPSPEPLHQSPAAPSLGAVRDRRPRHVRARLHALFRTGLGFIGSAVLAAVALVPAAEFARNSLRSQQGWSEQLAWSMSWPQVLSVAWPLADRPRGEYWGDDQWFLLTLFLGTLPCVLAILGAVKGPRARIPFLIGALLLTLLSLGKHVPLAAWLLQHVPPFTLFRYPVKYFVGAAFCIAVLAALGVDALGRAARTLPPSPLKLVASLLGIGVAIAASGPIVRSLPLRAHAATGTIWVLIAIGLAGLLLFTVPVSSTRPRRMRQALAALVLLELAAAHALLGVPDYTPGAPLRRAFALREHLPQPFQGRISVDIEGPSDPTRTGPTRTIERSLDRLVPNRSMEERLPALEGYGAPEPLRVDRFHLAGARSVYDLAGVTHYIRQGPPPFDDLELLHEADDGTTLSHSRTALPRAFLVQRAHVVTDDEALAAVLDEGQPFREQAFLASGAPLDRPTCGGTVSTVSSGLQHLELDVKACDESYLVVSDSHYPGWRATVDGKEVPIHRADHSLRAVYLTSGAHRVRFDYAPLSFRIGLGLSVLGWVSVAGVGLGIGRRRTLRA
ncbi:YfhO family protein [Myxococcus stipitatus]|uniref:YfhO family protein n=1 Tax=Myxococcus stipitatus TaxID=83455 RepID=UPI001F250F34|nr:YfhO family protein [Myxococcus stipitatus]MCE9668000.1 YfhO family protein [Myxococcus stipitatus]